MLALGLYHPPKLQAEQELASHMRPELFSYSHASCNLLTKALMGYANAVYVLWRTINVQCEQCELAL